MSDDSNKINPDSKSPAIRISELGRTGELKRQIENVLSDHDEKLTDDIKTHIDDTMQIILEAIDAKLPTIVEPTKNKRIEFYVGLGIGLSLLVGFVAGLLMRGIL